MIEGLVVEVTTERLASLIQVSIDKYKGKITPYKGKIEIPSFSEDVKQLEKKVGYFQFIKDNLVPNEIYRLNLGDLSSLEIAPY